MPLIFSTVWSLLPIWKPERQQQRKIDRATDTGTDRHTEQQNKERQNSRHRETAIQWLRENRERQKKIIQDRNKMTQRATER